jgi:hypothetical protein
VEVVVDGRDLGHRVNGFLRRLNINNLVFVI